MRFVVTGGLGFIGTSVVRRLQELDHEVIIVDFAEQLLKSYEKAGLPILKQVYKNLKNCDDLQDPYEFLNNPPVASAYIHLGACVDTRGVHEDLFERNIRYTRALTHALPYEARVVYASSAATYGTEGFPCNAYGMSKQLGENILKTRPSLRTTCLRFFNVYGRYENHKGDMASVPHKIAHAYKTRGKFSLFCPDASRDFISVGQVTDAVVGHALESSGPITWEAFDVGTGNNVSFRDLDYSLRILFNRPESICEETEMPASLIGHYQFFTKAGSRAEISKYVDRKVDIRDLLKEQFLAEDR